MTKKISRSMAAAVASAVLMASSAAQAATSIDATGFSLDYLGTEMGHAFAMSVLSDSGGTTRIGLDLGVAGHVMEAFVHGDGSDGDEALHLLAGSVKQGYRITSLTLSGVATGQLYLEPPLVCGGCNVVLEGTAQNGAGLGLSVFRGGLPALVGHDEMINRYATQPLQASLAAPIDGAFDLGLRTWNEVTVQRTLVVTSEPAEYWYNAFASAGVDDLVLTVQVSAVPEPATYAMLAGGLGMLAVLARRRRI